jgi:hypothetical protein
LPPLITYSQPCQLFLSLAGFFIAAEDDEDHNAVIEYLLHLIDQAPVI